MKNMAHAVAGTNARKQSLCECASTPNVGYSGRATLLLAETSQRRVAGGSSLDILLALLCTGHAEEPILLFQYALVVLVSHTSLPFPDTEHTHTPAVAAQWL